MFEINDNDLSSNDSSSNDASSDDASSKDVSSSSSSSNLDESVKSIRLHLDPSVTELVEPEPDPEISTNQGTKGLNKDYEFVATYTSLILAKQAIVDKEIGNQLWTRGCSYTTNIGDKINYTCRGHPKCPKRVQFLLDPSNQDVHVHLSTGPHDHQPNHFSRCSLNPVSKKKVLELLDCGVTQPRRLLKELEKNNLPALSRSQINNLKSRVQRKVITPGPFSRQYIFILLFVLIVDRSIDMFSKHIFALG